MVQLLRLFFGSKDGGVKYYRYIDGQFKLKDTLKLNTKGKINSMGVDVTTFLPQHKNLMDNFFSKGYRLRFSNSLCLDTHQILFKKGGIYSNPATKQNPNGKLNIIFEAFGISYIIELAGGEAIDGKTKILDIKEVTLEQNTSIYFGSKDEIAIVRSNYAS
jgi:fructose-1,6-bisphosphatase I